MKYAGSSIVTPRQVGSSAVVIENDILYNVTIAKTRSTKAGAGSVIISYWTHEFTKWFPAAELYDDASAAKTAFSTLSPI